MDKTCRDCGETKSVSCFYRRYDKGEGHYRNSCKECLGKKKYKQLSKPRRKYKDSEERAAAARERAKEWYKNNTESAKKRVAEYYQTEHGKQKRRESLAKRKEKNPEYWRLKKKRDKAIRRSRELEAGDLNLSSITALEVYNKNNFGSPSFTCEYCGKESQDYHLEHLVPLSKGGSNEVDNLGIACKECNLQKGAKTHLEFMPGRKLYFENRKL